MKIYTKTGDSGETGLFGGKRVKKNAAQIAAAGDLDELNSVLGVAVSLLTDQELYAPLQQVQQDLFRVGAEVASVAEKREKLGIRLIGSADVAELERAIDAWEKQLTPLKNFILPGGSAAAAMVHHARAVCRRSERTLISLAAAEELRAEILMYLNRLADWLFVFARFINQRANTPEIAWRHE